jgi:DNA polymerase
MSINSNFSYLFFLKDSGVNSFLQNSPNKHYKATKNDAPFDRVSNSNNIQNIESLNQLEGFIKTSDNCPLKNQALNTVFADGNPSSKIMLIGEAPGAEEDKLGKPFVGAAGQLLNKMLAAINLDRNSVYITNIVPWRPPNNRAPNTEEILQCLPFIQKHIEIIQPSILVLLGGTATKAILATTLGITKIRGKWHKYNSLNIKVPILTIAVYHPAFLLRSPGHKKEAWEDLQKIQKKITTMNNEDI